jgi:hypothetical protein
MRIGEDLARWLDDAGADARSIANQRDFMAGWDALIAPVLARLADEASIAALLADDAWLGEAIGWVATRLIADPFLDPPLRMVGGGQQRGVLIGEGPAASLSAIVKFNDGGGGRGAGTIVATGARTMIRFVRAGGLNVRLWRIDGEHCRPGAVRRVDDGECLMIDGTREAWTIEEAQGAIVSLRATMTAERAPLVREYDRQTGRLVRRSAADPDISRAQMMLALLRLMERRDAAPLFAQFIEGDDAYLRWQAMREWLALDAVAALPHLRRLAAREGDGPARRTLAMVEARMAEAA